MRTSPETGNVSRSIDKDGIEYMRQSKIVAEQMLSLTDLSSLVVRVPSRGCGRLGFHSLIVSNQRRQTGRFALLRLALGINKLGNRLACWELV